MTTQPFATVNQYVLTHDPAAAARKRRRWLLLAFGAIAMVVALLAWALWPQAHVAPPPRQLPPPPLPPLAERSWRDLRVVLPDEDEFPPELRPVEKSWEPYPLAPTAQDQYAGSVASDNLTSSVPECAYFPLDPTQVQTLVSEGKFNIEVQQSKFVKVPSHLGIDIKMVKWSVADRSAELDSWIEQCAKFDQVMHWEEQGIKISLTQANVIEKLQDEVITQTEAVGVKDYTPSVVWHVTGVPLPDEHFTVADEYTYIAFVRGVVLIGVCDQFPGKQDYLPAMQKMFLEAYQKTQALP